jgi:hypothetical protein
VLLPPATSGADALYQAVSGSGRVLVEAATQQLAAAGIRWGDVAVATVYCVHASLAAGIDPNERDNEAVSLVVMFT